MAAVKKVTPPYPVTHRQYKLIHTLIGAGMDDKMMRVLIKNPDLVEKMIDFIKLNESHE